MIPMIKVTKYLIEMMLPDDVDPSELLERMQEIAVDYPVECADEDYDDDDALDKEAVRDTVSVQAVKS